MKKYTKKEITKALENIKEIMEGEGDIVVVTDNMQIIKGNPIGVTAHICRVLNTIKDQDVLGKICVAAALNTMKEEKIEPSEEEKEDAVEDLFNMLVDAVKNL